jgi:hypothetical protein
MIVTMDRIREGNCIRSLLGKNIQGEKCVNSPIFSKILWYCVYLRKMTKLPAKIIHCFEIWTVVCVQIETFVLQQCQNF